jgi:uncharacterized phage protein gp47/JayE
LSDTYDIDTAMEDAQIEISNYITSLNIDDDVLKSKITQAIMNVPGILNIYDLIINGISETEQHTYNTGTSIYNMNYKNGGSWESFFAVVGKKGE